VIATEREQVRAFYDRIGPAFDGSYDWEGALYPSNRIRLDHALDLLAADRRQQRLVATYRVLDAGCGTGIAMAELLERGYDAYGYDFSASAVSAARARLGQDARRVIDGDLEDSPPWAGSFDAALVIGAFTHPLNHALALRHLHAALQPGGLLIVELRNELFDLYTANEYTIASLRRWLPEGPLTDAALASLAMHAYRRLTIPDATEAQRAHEAFFAVPAVWRNPLTVAAEYRAAGFRVDDTLFFHWHAVPPAFEALDPAGFRRASLALEKDPRDWRGHFLASAFLLVARREEAA